MTPIERRIASVERRLRIHANAETLAIWTGVWPWAFYGSWGLGPVVALQFLWVVVGLFVAGEWLRRTGRNP